MELFRLEHKRLWSRNSVKISVILCFLYVVILCNILCFQWFIFGTSDDHTSNFGNNFDGYSAIRERQEYAHLFGEELTDETLQQLVQDYQRMDAADRKEDIEKTDHWTVNNWLYVLWPELEDTGEYHSIISYVDPGKLTGLYERRQQALETFLENNEQTGAEREYLLQMNQRVSTPFRYGWTDGWTTLLVSTVADLGIVMALFIAIALSTLFAGEWHDRTGPLLLTTKNGWEKVAAAKILVGLSFTVELFIMLAVGGIISQLFFLGTTGWDMPIQSIKMIAVAPMNMLQGEIYEYIYTL
ncbi:MAG: ABC transporter permease, partial [Lachnospiraceae bacterium]|nr:ABC transporter permease [Lachnospiraceae bacterium]